VFWVWAATKLGEFWRLWQASFEDPCWTQYFGDDGVFQEGEGVRAQ
jgi:hypothetical protein